MSDSSDIAVTPPSSDGEDEEDSREARLIVQGNTVEPFPDHVPGTAIRRRLG